MMTAGEKAPGNPATGRRLWLVPIVVGVVAAGVWYSAERRAARRANDVIVLGNGRPKLFEFGMGVCEPCKRREPVMKRARAELGDRRDVHVLDVHDDFDAGLAETYHLRTVPLVVLTDPFGAELWRHEGFIDFPELSQAVTAGLAPR